MGADRELIRETAMAMCGIEVCSGLSAAELRRRAGYANKRRLAMRMRAIANVLDGYDRKEAARLEGMSDQALRDAIKRYNAEGLAGLGDRFKPGRKRKLDAEREALLSQAILDGPDPEVDGISSYTLDDLTALVKSRWGISYHPSSMSRVVRRMNFSRQKARPSHPKKDPAAAAAFKKSPGHPQGDCRYT
jgi:transposase